MHNLLPYQKGLHFLVRIEADSPVFILFLCLFFL
nr:MAG TPA: hypothetical protein [Caudoviricetes sp.]